MSIGQTLGIGTILTCLVVSAPMDIPASGQTTCVILPGGQRVCTPTTVTRAPILARPRPMTPPAPPPPELLPVPVEPPVQELQPMPMGYPPLQVGGRDWDGAVIVSVGTSANTARVVRCSPRARAPRVVYRRPLFQRPLLQRPLFWRVRSFFGR